MNRSYQYYTSARQAFKDVLKLIAPWSKNQKILLPAYIGWSSREGSGVFDPVRDLNLSATFYRLNNHLCIDIESIIHSIETNDIKAILLIHYFGYVDKNYNEIIKIARERNIFIIEDEAHAFYSDHIGGTCGRYCNVAFFSLHKMFPFEEGGMLSINDWNCTTATYSDEIIPQKNSPWNYDLVGIAQKRKKNADFLLSKSKEYPEQIEPLWTELPEGVYPQSFPIIIKKVDRDKLYYRMNELGFGVVSLYHTLIKEISKTEYSDSYNVSRKILNLPVHQDTDINSLNLLWESLCQNIEDLS